MNKRQTKVQFKSPLGEMMSRFIKEKQSYGYRYETESQAIGHFDRFLCEIDLRSMELPRHIIDRWIAKRPHERPRTHQSRISIVRQLALYLSRQGLNAYVPEVKVTFVNRMDFVPYIFRHEEIKRLLEASDRLPSHPCGPLRHLIMPEIFRLLYCCGMRLNEVLNLRVADVNLIEGILTVRMGKFKKDRLVPMAPSMTVRLRKYSMVMGERKPDDLFFPAPDGGPYSKGALSYIFRSLLRECGIPYRGKGRGPRLHDVRHSFAVHRLESWYRQGADFGNKLPVLATYMGHKDLTGTQRYLRLTPEIFPEITKRLEKVVGHIIPWRRKI